MGGGELTARKTQGKTDYLGFFDRDCIAESSADLTLIQSLSFLNTVFSSPSDFETCVLPILIAFISPAPANRQCSCNKKEPEQTL